MREVKINWEQIQEELVETVRPELEQAGVTGEADKLAAEFAHYWALVQAGDIGAAREAKHLQARIKLLAARGDVARRARVEAALMMVLRVGLVIGRALV